MRANQGANDSHEHENNWIRNDGNIKQKNLWPTLGQAYCVKKPRQQE